MMFEEAIIISKCSETGRFETRVNLENVGSTITAGMMLASATRVIGLAFAENEQDKGIEEQVIAHIAQIYADDLVKGDLGESENFFKE